MEKTLGLFQKTSNIKECLITVEFFSLLLLLFFTLPTNDNIYILDNKNMKPVAGFSILYIVYLSFVKCKERWKENNVRETCDNMRVCVLVCFISAWHLSLSLSLSKRIITILIIMIITKAKRFLSLRFFF